MRSEDGGQRQSHLQKQQTERGKGKGGKESKQPPNWTETKENEGRKKKKQLHSLPSLLPIPAHQKATSSSCEVIRQPLLSLPAPGRLPWQPRKFTSPQSDSWTYRTTKACCESGFTVHLYKRQTFLRGSLSLQSQSKSAFESCLKKGPLDICPYGLRYKPSCSML